MNKLMKLKDFKLIIKEAKGLKLKISLITGCFDILHYGHIELFNFAKANSDLLVVGIDNDNTIKVSKGENRPIFSSEIRAKVLSAISHIDYIFIIEENYKFGAKNLDYIFNNIMETIKPNFIVTTKEADKHWSNKEKKAKEYGAELLLNTTYISTSSTEILSKIGL